MLEACRQKKHPLIRIYSYGSSSEADTVRWCPGCGAIVVDVDFDNRTNPGAVMKMRLPKVSKEAMK